MLRRRFLIQAIAAALVIPPSGRLLAQIPDDPSRYLGGLNLLGQPLWSPSGPNGFADTNAAWAAPEGMKLRLDIDCGRSTEKVYLKVGEKRS